MPVELARKNMGASQELQFVPMCARLLSVLRGGATGTLALTTHAPIATFGLVLIAVTDTVAARGSSARAPAAGGGTSCISSIAPFFVYSIAVTSLAYNKARTDTGLCRVANVDDVTVVDGVPGSSSGANDSGGGGCCHNESENEPGEAHLEWCLSLRRWQPADLEVSLTLLSLLKE